MKYIRPYFICLLLLLFSFASSKAQVNFATYVNLSAKISAVKKRNGNAFIHFEKGRFNIYALFKNGLVNSLYAVDMKGDKLNGFISRGRKGCDVSFRSRTDGKLLCYDLDCTLLPIPQQQTALKK